MPTLWKKKRVVEIGVVPAASTVVLA